MNKQEALIALKQFALDNQLRYEKNIEVLLKKFPDNIDFNLITEQDFSTVFSLTDITDYNSLNSLKAKLKSFLSWAYENNYIQTRNFEFLSKVSFSNLDRERYIQKYFVKNWNDLYKNLIFYFEEADERLLTIQVALILSFFGMTVKEMIECRKEDVNEFENTITLRNGNKIIIPSPAFRTVVFYKNLEQFYSPTPKERTFKIPDGIYLLRNSKTAQFTTSNCVHLKDIANNKLRDRNLEKRIKWDTIYQSGQMSRLYEFEKKNGKISAADKSVLQMFLGVKKFGTAYDFYMKWKQYFYGNE